MLVSLYTVRVVLNVLGVEDYGINNVVAGFVTMFSFLSAAMTSASQRYFSYDIGKGDNDHLNRTFCVTIIIYIFLCIVVVVVAETAGLWFVLNKMIIPAERRTAAIWVYQFSIISFIMTLITTPYKASIIAHESMDVYAYISIIEVVLKLAVVFVLQVIPLDRLILYGLLHCIVVIINTLLYRGYAKVKFPECKIHLIWDPVMFKDMLSFSGWNLFGSIAYMLKNQGLNVVLNLFFGPVINASRAVAYQINNAVVTFSQNFITAIRPQIVKKYASEETEKAYSLVYIGSKLSYYLMYIFTLPLCLELNFVLKLWLKKAPDLTLIFTSLVLIDALIDSVNNPVITLLQSTGKIKWYQIIVGGILLLNVPVSYVMLRLGYDSYIVFIITIILTVVGSIARLIMAQIYASMKVKDYIYHVYVPCFFVTIFSFIIPYVIRQLLEESFLRFVIVVGISVLITLIGIYIFGINKDEKTLVKQIVRNKLRKKA